MPKSRRIKGAKMAYHDDIGASLFNGPKWTPFREPVPLGVLVYPLLDYGSLIWRNALARLGNSLHYKNRG